MLLDVGVERALATIYCPVGHDELAHAAFQVMALPLAIDVFLKLRDVDGPPALGLGVNEARKMAVEVFDDATDPSINFGRRASHKV